MGIQVMRRTHLRVRSAGRVYECFVLQHDANMPSLVLAVNPNYDLQKGCSLLAIKTIWEKTGLHASSGERLERARTTECRKLHEGRLWIIVVYQGYGP